MNDQCYGQTEMCQGIFETYRSKMMCDAVLTHHLSGKTHVKADLNVYVEPVTETILPCPTLNVLAADSCFYTVLPVL